MTRWQSFIGISTLLVCLIVGLWASQRPPSPELIAEIAPASRKTQPVEPPEPIPAKSDDALIEEILSDEPGASTTVAPRKLVADEDGSVAEHPVARLLVKELPDATEEERQIWFEELRDLPLSAVQDVLKVRRNARPLADDVLPLTPQKLEPLPVAVPAAAQKLSAETRRTLQQYRAVLLQNLLNVDTVGYRCIEPQLSGVPSIFAADNEPMVLEGLRWVGSRLKLKRSVFDITDRSLDLAIAGAGWFVVTDANGTPAYTRNGAFQVSEQRELELITPQGPRRVHPLVKLPDAMDSLFVDTHGSLFVRTGGKFRENADPVGQIQLARFFDDSALTLSEDGLYRPLPQAGAVRRLTPGDDCGPVHEGVLERSNVDVASQRETLRRVEQWLAGSWDDCQPMGKTNETP